MKNLQISSTKTQATESDEKLSIIKIAFLDVGQADTIVISCAETHEAIVVDCVDAKAVLDYLKKEQITYLRGIIITHLHADHYSGVAALLNGYHLVPGTEECEVLACTEIIDKRNLQKLSADADEHASAQEQPSIRARKSISTSLSNLFEWCQQNKLKCAEIKVERRVLPFEGTLAKSLQLVHPYHVDYATLRAKGLNNTSVVLRIKGSNSSAPLTGDLEPEGWQQLQANHPNLHSDILKFPHHGGAWDRVSAEELLDNIQPSVVIISVGTEGSKYKHPNEHVFTALAQRPHVRVLCTQATDQCQKVVLNRRDAVMQQLEAEAGKSGYLMIASRRGCPCAGTVIIELGDDLRVLQPEVNFHREHIIRPYFRGHKCNISDAKVEYMIVGQQSAESR